MKRAVRLVSVEWVALGRTPQTVHQELPLPIRQDRIQERRNELLRQGCDEQEDEKKAEPFDEGIAPFVADDAPHEATSLSVEGSLSLIALLVFVFGLALKAPHKE